MSDPTAGRPGVPPPDFLDRLLARHADPAAVRRPGVVRVRPRLPGPFERVEAVRGGRRDEDPDGAREPLRPVTAPPAEHREGAARTAAREVLRTEHERTVVGGERAPEALQAPRPTAPLVPGAPPLRPVAPPVTPGPRQEPGPGRRTQASRDGTHTAPGVRAAPDPAGPDAAPRPAGTGAPRPSAADTAAARDAVRQASARRTGRGPEQVVRVQIGRVEVTAAEPPGAARARLRDTARPQAEVSLADYLARGRE